MDPKIVAKDYGEALWIADSKAPQAKSTYRPGIGPHSERSAVGLVLEELRTHFPGRWSDAVTEVPYPEDPRKKCDICVGRTVDEGVARWETAIEVKMLRLLGDNGKPDDFAAIALLSPFTQHSSALTDCSKLARSEIAMQKIILIYGFVAEAYAMNELLDDFYTLASKRVELGQPEWSFAFNLVHPVHSIGWVYVVEIFGPA